jgi:hypothetical protein
MADPNALDFLRIPTETLISLDWRPFHFALQPYHYLVRTAHLLSMAAFFGGIGLLDLRLLGVQGAVRLRPFAEYVLPWLYVSFGIAVVTGLALFLYDPVHVGSHAYFSLKLLLTAFGLVNAGIFHRAGYLIALSSDERMPTQARWAGAISLALWTGVFICACLNAEGPPRVLLR